MVITVRKHFSSSASTDCVQRMSGLTLNPDDSDNEEINEYMGALSEPLEVTKANRKIKKGKRGKKNKKLVGMT